MNAKRELAGKLIEQAAQMLREDDYHGVVKFPDPWAGCPTNRDTDVALAAETVAHGGWEPVSHVCDLLDHIATWAGWREDAPASCAAANKDSC